MLHSPGPWRWDEDIGAFFDADGKMPIEGQEWRIPNDANGRLIAAAPDLLRLVRKWQGTSLGVHVDTAALQMETADVLASLK